MPSPSILLQHSLNVIDQFEFCRLHDAETHIVPEGLKKNYPINIDFDRLPKRVEELIPELILVIKGEIKSLYRDIALDVYQELGRARARKPTILMGRFQKFQPGYYGSKGASIIFSSLVSLFMNTNVLTMDMTKPQEPLEYLNQVLVPEAAIRLISQDRGGISLEEARKEMEDSVEFGMYVHDIEEDLDDE
ncbi:RTC4-like domain-containing protein [Glomus cerebriforme]|uniref:Restriction of telomere capping protein 4 n=1 Tax=Glomus cerebriforme TaxID=658196 RepID=A0A397T5Y8_9GLOM|nr:RTC4-like domain-containing protein [Glomus cerebriforme]